MIYPKMTTDEIRALPALMTVRDLHRLTGWNTSTISRKAKSGEWPWPCSRISGRWMFPTEKVLSSLGIDA